MEALTLEDIPPLERSVDAIRLLTDRKAYGKVVVMPEFRPH